MELQTAILTQLSSILTADAGMITAMGSAHTAAAPWLYPVWAKDDAPMPYLVHRCDLRAIDDFWPMRQGTYLLDIWSCSDNGAEALAIRDRIMTLLEDQSWNIDDGEGNRIITACRLWLQTEGFVPEMTDGIWHYVTQWNIRLYRTRETANILAR